MTASAVLWLIRSGEGGAEVDACIGGGVAAVGYPTVGDVRQRMPAQVLEDVKRARDRTDFDTLAQRLLDFAFEVQVGDLVATSDGARCQLVFGRVVGPYDWRENSPVPGMRHLRPVEWLGRANWDDLDDDARTTLVKYPRTILRITEPALIELAEHAVAGDVLPLANAGRSPQRRPTVTHRTQAPTSNERVCSAPTLPLGSRSGVWGRVASLRLLASELGLFLGVPKYSLAAQVLGRRDHLLRSIQHDLTNGT